MKNFKVMIQWLIHEHVKDNEDENKLEAKK